MIKFIASSMLVASLAVAADQRLGAIGSLSECIEGEDAEITDISSTQWPASYSLKLDAGDSCYYTTFMSSYAWWHSSQEIQVRTQTYEHPVGSESECFAAEDNIVYYSGTVLYTSQSEWPYTEDRICSHLYVLTNMNQEESQVVELYTNGSVILTVGSALIALSTLLF